MKLYELENLLNDTEDNILNEESFQKIDVGGSAKSYNLADKRWRQSVKDKKNTKTKIAMIKNSPATKNKKMIIDALKYKQAKAEETSSANFNRKNQESKKIKNNDNKPIFDESLNFSLDDIANDIIEESEEIIMDKPVEVLEEKSLEAIPNDKIKNVISGNYLKRKKHILSQDTRKEIASKTIDDEASKKKVFEGDLGKEIQDYLNGEEDNEVLNKLKKDTLVSSILFKIKAELRKPNPSKEKIKNYKTKIAIAKRRLYD